MQQEGATERGWERGWELRRCPIRRPTTEWRADSGAVSAIAILRKQPRWRYSEDALSSYMLGNLAKLAVLKHEI